MGDAMCDDARLARTCARKDQDGTIDGFNSEPLLWVERPQIHKCGRSLIFSVL
jgi:hypothetical protein